MKACLIVFAGKAGTGKTTLAREVAKRLGIAYLDYDTLNQSYLEAIEERYGLGDGDRYALYRAWRDQSYRTLLDAALENIGLGIPAVVSAPFSKELRDPSYPDALFDKAGCVFPLIVFYMAPPEDMHYHMVKSRSSRRDEDFIADRRRFAESYSSEKPRWDGKYIEVLDSGDLDRNIDIAMRRAKALMEEKDGTSDNEV